jgi:septal ring factor EnvC (AmiA/AmiB activator)
LFGIFGLMTIRRHIAVLLPALLAAAAWLPAAHAAEAAEVETEVISEEAAEARKLAREAELEAIRRSIDVSERRQASLREEIEGLEQDREGIAADLLATGKRLRATEEEIAETEERLEQLHSNEDAIRRSLHRRRDVMAEVLMALQRMGRTPPPAILSRPEDAVAAIRGSILAGAVLPDIRVEAEALAADLQELTRLTTRIEAERDALRIRYLELGEEETRKNLLVEAKQSQRHQTQAALQAEREKATQLADQAGSLESLIEKLESEVAVAAQAAEEARQAALATERAGHQDAARRLADTSRIAPAVRFADAKGLLTWPVTGKAVLGFDDPDGLGGTSQGLSIATRPGTSVLAPADGWVVYAGPFRSYGQVMILNAGDGYHVVLAGMERIDAGLGQFVLAGEPIAAMGATRIATIGELEHTSVQAILYIEFRRDGTAIDSSPWWAPKDNEVNG